MCIRDRGDGARRAARRPLPRPDRARQSARRQSLPRGRGERARVRLRAVRRVRRQPPRRARRGRRARLEPNGRSMADQTRRERLLTFLLLPIIVVAVLVLTGVMFRSSFQLEKLREQSVVEATLLLANEKADRLDKNIIDQDNSVRSLIDVREREEFGAKWLEVAALQTPTVREVLLIDLSSPDRDVVAVASRAPGPEHERFTHLLVHSMLGEMKLERLPVEELRHIHK